MIIQRLNSCEINKKKYRKRKGNSRELTLKLLVHIPVKPKKKINKIKELERENYNFAKEKKRDECKDNCYNKKKKDYFLRSGG
jgi:hypothetical protein